MSARQRAIDHGFGISSFVELRAKKPPLRISASADDGTNFIGVSKRYMEAHGIDAATLPSWGGCYIETTHPGQSLTEMREGSLDAFLQESVI